MVLCEFDPYNKLIKILEPTTDINASDMYKESMDWADNQPNMIWKLPMTAGGTLPMGGGTYSDSIYVLMDGWKIKPWSGNYQLRVRGTISTDDETPRTVLPDYGNVEMEYQVCSQGIIVEGSSPTEIADAVWDEEPTGHTGPGKAGEQLWTKVDEINLRTQDISDMLINALDKIDHVTVLTDDILDLQENRLILNVSSSEIWLYDDTGAVVIKKWPVKNKNGQPITMDDLMVVYRDARSL